ncbi:MAG: hypothetical protein AABX82_03595, partial [Nanoarchaeota archaeon]
MEQENVKKIGLWIVALAFLLNPYFIGLIFSADHQIENSIAITLIIGFEVFLGFLGIGMYYKERIPANLRSNGMLLIITSLFCFAILEGAIFSFGEYDTDGQFSFGGRDLLPYALPVHAIEKHIAVFENLTNPYVAIPDPYLGWTTGNNTNALQPLGYYQTNSIGVRSEREFNKTKEEGVLRIEMFGDSFVHSYDVPMNETLAFYLEQEALTQTEVMNFGVGAYGIDQAYLRWKLLGKEYNPDIILIGFQAENCKRNMNVVRKFYFRNTEIPFSKPRFILVNGSLVLVNYPTVYYKDVPNLVETFDRSPLSEYEYFYSKEDYKTANPFLYFKTVRYLTTVIAEYQDKKNDKMNYEEGEIRDVCYAILEKFYNEASVNATVYILHLPTQQDLALKTEGEEFVYEYL